ncbi:MAG: glycosyltransferase family 4 protein [Bdellovibrionales bacterium]|nr:glycosyltransferase family 4 protein [Bdellovibrionales bacterium]
MTSRLKILIYSQFYLPEIGAPPVRLGALSEELSKLGCDVRVVSAMPNYPEGRIQSGYRWRLFHSEQVRGIPVYRSFLIPIRSGGFARLISYFSFQLFSFPILLWQCLSFRPDYLFIESPPLFLGLTALLVRKVTGVPFILNVADLWPESVAQFNLIRTDSYYYRLAKKLESLLYRSSDVLSLTVPGHQDYIASSGGRTNKMIFFPNGAYVTDSNLPSIESTSPTLQPLFRTRKVVLYAGNHGASHGLEVLLRAAARLISDPNIHILFVGDGSRKAALLSLSASLNLSNVTFHPPVPADRILDLMRLSSLNVSIFVQPDSHARSAKIFPMLASGTPLVLAASNDGANIVRSAQAGVVVSPNDEEQLAEAISKTIYDDDLRTKLSQNAQKLISEEFSWDVLAARWLQDLAKIHDEQL